MSDTPKTVDEILEENKGKHSSILLIGFNTNGKIHIDTNRPTYEFVNYAVNRAVYNINHMETTEVLRREQASEQAVADQVAANMAEVAPKTSTGGASTTPKVAKRGRPKKSS